MVEHAVAALDLRHTAIPVETSGFLDKLRMLVRQHDAPVYTITYYVQWLLMEAIAKHGYRISISGTGADELFSGYYVDPLVGGGTTEIAPLVVLLIALLVRPYGLFGLRRIERI